MTAATTPAANSVSLVTQVCKTITTKKDSYASSLPKHISVEKFMRVAITAIQNSPDLQKIANESPAARNSIFTACSRAAADGLLPDGREGAIVGFKRKVSAKGQPDRWETHAQWMPMVEGLRKMVRNSGEISTISVQVVHQEDEFDYELGDNEFIKHKPETRKARGPIIGAYSIAKLKDGEISREYMDVGQIEEIKKRSKTSAFGPWVTDYSEMCRKTVFRRHYKSLPKSTDLDKVIENDEDGYDPSISAFAATQSNAGHNLETGEVHFDEPEQAAATTRKPRQSKRAAEAMKQADVVEVPAGKKAAAAEEEIEFENEDHREYDEQQEEDVV
jgi:phage RecT family recombinase